MNTSEEELLLLDRYHITPNELMFIKTLLILQDENDESLFKKYIEILHDNDIHLRDMLIVLQRKELINKSYKIEKKGASFDPYTVDINKNFIKSLYKSSFKMGSELFNAYPQFGSINGVVIGLRGISKKFDSLEDAFRYYGKSIGWNPDKHNHILELLKWNEDKNIINYSLASFLIDRRWLELESLMNGEGNINYDSVKLL